MEFEWLLQYDIPRDFNRLGEFIAVSIYIYIYVYVLYKYTILASISKIQFHLNCLQEIAIPFIY